MYRQLLCALHVPGSPLSTGGLFAAEARLWPWLGTITGPLFPRPERCVVAAARNHAGRLAGTMLTQKDYRYKVSLYATLMPSQITKHFEEYARCCSELAVEAATPGSRKRLLKMARDYTRAARLMRRTSESALLAAGKKR